MATLSYKSDWTRRGQAYALRLLFSYCQKIKLIESSPAADLTIPTADPPNPKVFSDTDIRKILAACTNAHDRAIVLVLLDTGLRAIEFVDLQVGDVSLASGEISVRSAKRGLDRSVFLGSTSLNALRNYLSERGQPRRQPAGALKAIIFAVPDALLRKVRAR